MLEKGSTVTLRRNKDVKRGQGKDQFTRPRTSLACLNHRFATQACNALAHLRLGAYLGHPSALVL